MEVSTKVRDGHVSFGPYETWYRISGDLQSHCTPLVILHGRPDCTYNHVDAFKDVAISGRAVIHCDLLGDGFSICQWNQDDSVWAVELFLQALDNLLDHLGISDNYALLGQSWGGMLASEHAVLRPAGLRALIIANSPASMRTWVEEANRLRQLLPEEVQQTLLRHERAGTTQSAEYAEATRVYYDRHVCRITPWPDEVARTFAQVDSDPTVYRAMNGPNEFHIVASLKDWTIVERLPRINVPTLVISGRYDEATPTVVKPYVEKIPNARWALFENSSHMPHVEERIACMGTVAGFLDGCL